MLAVNLNIYDNQFTNKKTAEEQLALTHEITYKFEGHNLCLYP